MYLSFGVENGGPSGEEKREKNEKKLYPCLTNLFLCLKSFLGDGIANR